MCVDYLLKNSIELSIIYIGIVNRYFEIVDGNQPLAVERLHEIAGCDKDYTQHWLECAQKMQLLTIVDSKIILTSLGVNYLFHNPHGKIHIVLRSIYSIILMNECMEFFQTGYVPGYSLIFSKPFKNLIPQYGYISKRTYLDSFKDIMQQKKIEALLSDAKIVADWGCGGAWFLDELSKLFHEQEFIGIDSEDIVRKNKTTYADNLRISFVDKEQAPKKCFDVIFINHAYHHFTNKLDMLAKIGESLSQGGSIVLWDYISTDDSDSEIAFLDLIEHIQGARYYTSQEIISDLDVASFSFESLDIGRTNQALLIIKPKQI